MSSESVCRLCLAMDAPVRITVDSPLQEVYTKLTKVSFNTAKNPLTACSFCYWQLRKCHKLMTRCLIANELLTDILQTGGLLKEESISMLCHVRYELRNNYLSCTPVEIMTIEREGMEHNLIKTEITEEAALFQSIPEMEVDPSTCVEHSECDRLDDEGDMALEDTQHVESQRLIDEEKVKCELLEKMLDVEDNNLPDEEDKESEGAASTEQCEQIHEEQIENGSTLTTDENNVHEKQRTRGTVVEEESTSTSAGRYMLRSTRRVTNNIQDLPNNCKYTAINSNLRKSDNNCNTDVDNSSSRHLKKTFICNDCGNTFDDKCLLIEHIEHHNVDKNNINRRSPRRTTLRIQRSNKTGVNKKTKTHVGKDVFQCEICQRRFTCNGHLKIHLQTHTGEKPFECKICKVKLSRKSTLKTHLLVHTGEKPFQCEICKVRLRDKSNLRKHLLVHTGEKPFECEICEVRFNRKSTLKTHLLVHTSEKSVECEICKRFIGKKYLRTHLLVHTGEKCFECEICKKRFIMKTHLKRHMLLHTGEKLFQCEICKVRFSQNEHLKRHLLVHTGEKPFECEICKVRFREKQHLNRHLHTRVHTDGDTKRRNHTK